MGIRVGIVTIVGNFNYGNRLQNYAVASIYHACGFETETLVCPKRSLVSSCRHLAADILRPRATSRPEEVMGWKRKEAFRRFSSMIPTAEVSGSLEELADQFNFFSVGSDQVWNPNYVDYYPWMYLQFARREQRVALAPSFGISQVVSPYARRMMAKGLSGFDRLSVREVAGAQLIKKITGQHAEVVIDPTLMLSADAWRDVANSNCVPKNPYIFAYLLGERSKSQVKYLEDLKRSFGAELVLLSDRSSQGEIAAGPAEFISLIDNACHVVTDSYHAAVFSMLLRTPLTIFRRLGGASLFSRLDTLVGQFDCSWCVFNEAALDTRDITRCVDLNYHDQLKKERERLARHLANSMNGFDPCCLAEGISGLA